MCDSHRSNGNEYYFGRRSWIPSFGIVRFWKLSSCNRNGNLLLGNFSWRLIEMDEEIIWFMHKNPIIRKVIMSWKNGEKAENSTKKHSIVVLTTHFDCNLQKIQSVSQALRNSPISILPHGIRMLVFRVNARFALAKSGSHCAIWINRTLNMWAH